MPRAIVNSTPIILLAGIGRLSLLPKLYDRILIPNAVYEEVTAKADLASRAISGHPSWLTVERAPELPREQRRLISAKLHAGEIEVMSLALSSDADVVVLDDRAARKTAKFFGLPVTGTLGLLLRAKDRGMVEEVLPLIDGLRANGFRVEDRVIACVLELAHEH